MSRRISSLSTLIAVGILLVGCSSTPEPGAAPAPTAVEPSATPSPSATEETLPTLFTISARVRSIDGMSIDISLVGHPPLASTDPEAESLVNDFVAECQDLNGVSVTDNVTPVSPESLDQFGSSVMRLDFTSTPEGPTYAAPVDLALGSLYFAEIVVGDTVQAVEPTPTCTGRYQVTGSAPAVGIANFESGSKRPDLNQWVYGHYGFTLPFESGATIEACKVEISPDAAIAIGETPGWEPGSDATGISCGIGYRGE